MEPLAYCKSFVFKYLKTIGQPVLKRLWISQTFQYVSSTCHTYAGDYYNSRYRKSLEHPEEFWSEVAKDIEWMKPFEQVLDNSNPPFAKWFVGGTLNTCHNAVDRHVLKGYGNKTAIIYDSPITGKKDKMSYHRLRERVSRLAGLLASIGVKKGDVVLIYMPMVADTIVGMLATSRIGAIHCVVFGGFAAPQLAVRINQSKPKVILSASLGLEPSRIIEYKPILDEAIRLSIHKPKHCVILNREGYEKAHLIKSRDLDWAEAEEKARPHDPVPVEADHPAYILHTSGTTGSPKGIVRPTGGHAVVLPWTMKFIYGLSPGDVWWAASDFGWVVGHSYICYAPLLNGNTTVVYEGKPVGTPDEKQYFRVINEYGVKAMFTAPTALRAIAKEYVEGTGKSFDISSLRHLFVAGEPLDHETRVWAEKVFQTGVLDHWWQTETGYAITAHCIGLGMSAKPPRGATGKPFMGYDVRILNHEGKEVPPRVMGRIVCKLPLPPGNFSSLFLEGDRFKETYFSQYPGYYDTMDAGLKDEQGFVSVQSRDDDVINVAGHRLSTLTLEEAILQHDDVVEAAVVGVPDALKGQIPLGLFVRRKGCDKCEEQLRKEVVDIVRRQVGPVASFKLCSSTPALPKTRSGKIPRKSIAELANDHQVIIPPTIEDSTVYKDILSSLRSCGVGLKAPAPIFQKEPNLI